MLERLSSASQYALGQGQKKAHDDGHPFHSGYVLVALLETAAMKPILIHYDIPKEVICATVANLPQELRLQSLETDADPGANLLRIVRSVVQVADVLEEDQAGCECLLLGLLANPDSLSYLVLKYLGVDVIFAGCILVAKTEKFEGGIEELQSQLLGCYSWVYDLVETLMRQHQL